MQAFSFPIAPTATYRASYIASRTLLIHQLRANKWMLRHLSRRYRYLCRLFSSRQLKLFPEARSAKSYERSTDSEDDDAEPRTATVVFEAKFKAY